MNNADSFRLEQKTAMVTGATGNLGWQISLGLALAGADIALIDLPSREKAAERLANEIRGAGRSASFVALDLRETDAFSTVVEHVSDELGPIDILVNNAFQLSSAPFLEQTRLDFDDLMQIGLRGTYFLSQVVVQQMIDRGIDGSIIHVASRLALQPRQDWSAYGAIKAAIVHLGRMMALELGRYGIRVNSIAPGAIAAGVADSSYPLGRELGYDDIPATVVFLASDAARMVTGQVLVIDGGLSLRGPL